MKAYLGPEYDGSGLEKARELVKQTMSTFPDRQASYENLYHTLDLINDQEAERTYKVGEYYKRIGKVTSAEYYFGKIPQRWPSSPWAVKSKTELAQLAKMPRKPSVPSKIMTRPGSNDPFYSGMGGMGMGGWRHGRWRHGWHGRHGRHGRYDARWNGLISLADRPGRCGGRGLPRQVRGKPCHSVGLDSDSPGRLRGCVPCI